MSSHREAPEISKDPVADNTDVYAFVSPDKPDTVTIITNYIPLQGPSGGPNFYEFGDDVLYEINIDNNGDGVADISYQFRFQTKTRNPNSFLYNTGQIESIDSQNWNRRQFYSVTRVHNGKTKLLANNLKCPPCNVGWRSTPNYANLSAAAISQLPDGEMVFAGQRDEGFYVDLGSIFDLLDLRPFRDLHLIPSPAAPGVDATDGLNVHTIALQIPKKLLTRDGSNPQKWDDPRSVIGVWGAAYRRRARVRWQERNDHSGPWVQVSRLGNPLFNEVIVPLGKKDLWNALPPSKDKNFLSFVQQPEVAKLIPILYPGVFPNLQKLTADRADLVAILLTGIPSGLIPNFQNYTGKTYADQLRLNMAIPPSQNPSPFGLLGGDLAGFPNGRRVADNVVAIEFRAIAGVTYPLIDKNFEPDMAAAKLTDDAPSNDPDAPYLSNFPYLGVANPPS